jgi:hypothetical protein
LFENKDDFLDQKERDTPVLVSPMAGGLGRTSDCQEKCQDTKVLAFSERKSTEQVLINLPLSITLRALVFKRGQGDVFIFFYCQIPVI